MSFERLGYHSLEKECEDNNGFVLDDNPNDMENICMDIIEETIAEIYGRFFTASKFPERKIITNDTAIYHGMAYVIKNRKRMDFMMHYPHIYTNIVTHLAEIRLSPSVLP